MKTFTAFDHHYTFFKAVGNKLLNETLYLFNSRKDGVLVEEREVLFKVKVVVHGADGGTEAVLVLVTQSVRSHWRPASAFRKRSRSKKEKNTSHFFTCL
jgi:hypothetical protein